MYYGSDEVERALTCSFCQERFVDEIKLIPDCGNCICGRCYAELKEEDEEPTATATLEYQCVKCQTRHLLPPGGLADCTQLLLLLKSKPLEKPLSEKARALRTSLRELQDRVARLREFDADEVVNTHCDQLELEVGEAAESAVRHLRQIERQLLEQIRLYRDKCASRLTSAAATSSTVELVAEITRFGAEWVLYFDRVEAFVAESTIEAALTEVIRLDTEIRSKEAQMRELALDGQEMRFKVNSAFIDNFGHIGGLEDLLAQIEPAKSIQPEATKMAPVKPVPIAQTKSVTTPQAKPPKTVNNKPPEVVQPKQPQAKAPKDPQVKPPQVVQPKPPQPRASKKPAVKDKKVKLSTDPIRDWKIHHAVVNQVLLLPNWTLASCSADKTIKISDVYHGLICELTGHSGAVTCLAALSHGRLASGSVDETIKIWNVALREEVLTLEGHTDAVVALCVLPKDGTLASYSWDNSIRLWNTNPDQKNLLSVLNGHGNTGVWAQLFGTLSSGLLVAASSDEDNVKNCVIKVWNPKEKKSLGSISIEHKGVSALLVLANDKLALGTDNGDIVTTGVDLDKNGKMWVIKGAHERGVTSLAQLANGGCLVSAGKENGSHYAIKLWSIADLSLRQMVVTDHTNTIRSLTVSLDGNYLASSSFDRSIKIWSVEVD